MADARDQRPECHTGGVTAASPDPAHLAERLERSAAGLVALADAFEAGAPWPVSDRFGAEPEAVWGPPETLAHVAEMLPFWTGELERVLAGPDGPVPFGRVASDQLRIGIIERDRTLPGRELFARVSAGSERLAGRLRELDAAAAARRGRHPTLGEMTAAALVERFAVGHLEEHLAQLRELLGTPA